MVFKWSHKGLQTHVTDRVGDISAPKTLVQQLDARADLCGLLRRLVNTNMDTFNRYSQRRGSKPMVCMAGLLYSRRVPFVRTAEGFG